MLANIITNASTKLAKHQSDSVVLSACSPRQMDLVRNVVVEVRESNAVLGADRLSDDDLVDVIELIPVFVSTKTR